MNKSVLAPVRQAIACACFAALASPGLVAAQAPPDAGSLLQQIEQQRAVPLPPKAAPLFTPPAPMQSLGGATITVTAFRFAGNILLSSEQLAPSVVGLLGRPIGFADLQNAAIAVAATYRRAGWIVRVYLPKQEIEGGVVTIQVIEARFGAVRLEGENRRISGERLRRIVEAAQPPGSAVNGDSLDRALLLLDDLPGLSVTGRLSEGQNQAETDLVLAPVDGPLLSGDVTADNTGARSTGSARVSASANLNSPLRFGDLASVFLMHSEGSDYGRAAYSVPMGSSGWRVGVNASHLAYKVVTPEFEQLDAKGNSTTFGALATYPLIRSRLKNLYLSLAFDHKHFDNSSLTVTTTRYDTEAASLGLYGNLFDDLGGGGANTAGVTLLQGRVDLGGSPNESADAATTRTAGDFHLLRFNASRQQVLTDALSLFAGVSGQLAGKNLDSSEKFYLGGAGGVRAYPASEAGGSEGLLLNLEARARLPANFNASGFFDWGTVRVNENNDIPGATVVNRYDLKGVGISVGWVASFGLAVKATVARRIGNNPNSSVTGNDQDGTLKKTRVWLQASLPF
ncbi:MAG: ShlB/FhaC/HecB family hemolysin secretion/activation protein [Caldimonas sp.]